MTAGIILLNFGEPENATREQVVPFLERIFVTNASLEGGASPASVRQRSREMAERRAPGLIEEYEEIGGSPLNGQARAQADAVARELTRRGYDVRAYAAFQFTNPLTDEIVRAARDDGVDTLVGLPVYPLCGPSTTVAALEGLSEAVRDAEWDVPVHEISGWHRHPGYARLRARDVEGVAEENGLELTDASVRLVFSAHGTPMKYIREGSRYVLYVEENCRAIAAALDVDDYVIGYQNHTNRPIEWTPPDIEDVVEAVDADGIVVVPVSFMHEQSETLAELDHELREQAEARGLAFHRVPVPHDAQRFTTLLADLVEPVLGDANPAALRYAPCVCRRAPGAVCLNSVSQG